MNNTIYELLKDCRDTIAWYNKEYMDNADDGDKELIDRINEILLGE